MLFETKAPNIARIFHPIPLAMLEHDHVAQLSVRQRARLPPEGLYMYAKVVAFQEARFQILIIGLDTFSFEKNE